MDLACMIAFALKRSIVSKLITNQNSSPMHLIFFAPGANEFAFCCHFVHSLKKHRRHIRMNSQQWIESMERTTPNFSVLISTEPQLVSHPSNPNFYRLNIDSNDWNTMMHSIIKFLKEEKANIDKRDVRHTLIVTIERGQTHELSKMLVLYKLFFITSIQCIPGTLSPSVPMMICHSKYVHPKIITMQLLLVMY